MFRVSGDRQKKLSVAELPRSRKMAKYIFSITTAVSVCLLVLLAFVAPVRASSPLAPASASVVTTVPLDGKPKGVTYNPDLNRIYVALFDTSEIAMLDGTTHALVGTADPQALSPNQIAYNAFTTRFYVTNRDSKNVSFHNAASGAWLARSNVGTWPWGIATDNASDVVYAANFGSGSVTIFSGDDSRTIKSVNLPNDTGSVDAPALIVYSATSGRAYVTGWFHGHLYVIDPALDISKSVDVGMGALGVAVDTNTETVYVTNRLTKQLFAVDGSVPVAQMAILQTRDLAAAPYNLAFNPNTKHLFVVAEGAAREYVYVFDTTTMTLLQTLTLGASDEDEGGQGIAINPTTNEVYVTNYADNTLTIIQDSSPYRFSHQKR